MIFISADSSFAGDTTGQLQGQFGGDQSQVDSSQPSSPAFEVLRGNGTRAGYILSHGSIIPGSESVTVGGSKKRRDKDYYIDYVGGSIVFTEPVQQTHAVSVSYRYGAGDNGERNLVGIPGLAIADTKNLSLNMTYSYQAGNQEQGTGNIATYGFNSVTKLGGGSLKTMLLISSPQNDQQVINLLAPKNSVQPSQPKAKRDEIIVQEGDFNFGGLKLKMGYQDIGKNFSGFTSLQAANPDLAGVLSQLAKESGMKRTNLGLSFASHGKEDSPLNELGFSSISDASGQIGDQSALINFGKLGFSYSHRSIDSGFARLGSLSEDEINQMALNIRRQLDSGAIASQVTDDDRGQILTEAGMERSNIGMSFDGGSFKTDFRMLQISDGKGGIERRTAGISGDGYSLSFMDQSIDESFERLGGISAVEKAQFGSERGLHRTNMTGGIKTGAGDLSLGFSKINSSNGAGMMKQSFGFAGKTFSIQASLLDIDPEFDRIGDLVDIDKNLLQQERGFKRMDLTANLKLSDRVDLSSFYYDSNNASSNLSRQQIRNQLSYTTGFGARISLFRDKFTSAAADGSESGYLHQFIKLDHSFKTLGGLAFSGLHDTNQTIDVNGSDIIATISQMHLESDKSKRAWAVADRKMVDFGNGKIENTQSYNLASRLSSAMNLVSSFVAIDRGADGGEDARTYGLQWAISKRLNFAANSMDRNGTVAGVTANRSYTLSGIITDSFLMFSNLKITAGRSVEDRQGLLFKETNAAKIEANLLKGNFVMEYAAQMDAGRNHPLSRGFSFVSDRDEKNRIKFDIAYKSRDLGLGDPIAIRCYNLDYKLSASTILTYNHFSFREKSDGIVEPVGGTVLKFAAKLRAFAVLANFKEEENFASGIDHDIYELGISGRLSSGALVEVGYSVDSLGNPGGHTKGHTYRAKYDQQLSPDHYLTLSSELKTIDTGSSTQRELKSRIDFHIMFN